MNREKISQDLTAITKRSVTWKTDEWGNYSGRLKLRHPGIIVEVAKYLASQHARLCTMTAYADQRSDPQKRRSLAYHFAIEPFLLTVTTPLYDLSTYEPLPVSSITSWFRNADWNEREFHEMFNIQVVGHPNPKRLFLDERLDAGIMEQLIPFSAMVHGINSNTLWEKVMGAKAAATIEEEREAVRAAYVATLEKKSDDDLVLLNPPMAPAEPQEEKQPASQEAAKAPATEKVPVAEKVTASDTATKTDDVKTPAPKVVDAAPVAEKQESPVPKNAKTAQPQKGAAQTKTPEKEA